MESSLCAYTVTEKPYDLITVARFFLNSKSLFSVSAMCLIKYHTGFGVFNRDMVKCLGSFEYWNAE